MSEATGTSGATLDPGATPGPGSTTDDDAGARPTSDVDLGDSGRRVLTELRREMRTKDGVIAEQAARLTEMENAGRSEVERLRSDTERLTEELRAASEKIASHDHDALRRQVADAAGIGEWWRRLQGATEDELTADAKDLAERVNSQGTGARPDLGAGARPGSPATGDSTMSDRIRRHAGR